ncbi:thioredoxin-like protein [Fimicolochytrium jonesii]|uniref:thioredoxin-like protein n=1 Tax=Fimicolochytrium jonesii TaxID=1396493 RepID=UPI0022FE2D6C|nr:thioredoxin-like protein [Fimicolochytrium jonesii]KAI8815820.1 thioredoxin-like protein [Fimicolochytrium jonesii]
MIPTILRTAFRRTAPRLALGQARLPLARQACPAAARAFSVSSFQRTFASDYEEAPSQATVGLPAPGFRAQAVVNGEFKTVSLEDYKGKYVVLFFYPMDFTFVCPTEIIAFSERIEEFRALNAEVIGASTDTRFSHLAWTQMPRKQGGLGEMKIPLIADPTKDLAHDYGVLIQQGDDAGVALRGTFIIDPQGKLRIAHINDLPIGRNVDEYLRLVEALTIHAEVGEVCPANWSKGSDTMKADPNGSKEYFGKKN